MFWGYEGKISATRYGQFASRHHEEAKDGKPGHRK